MERGGRFMSELVLLVGCVGLLLGAAFLYVKREGNDYATLVESMNATKGMVMDVKKELDTIKMSGVTDLTDYKKRLEDVEVKADKFIEFTAKPQEPIRILFPKGIRALIREDSSLPKPPIDLLNRAGIAKKKTK